MATANSVIENKLVQLKLIVGRTKKILESGNQEAVERHFFNFIIRYPSLAYRNTMDLQVKNIILNYIYNL